MKFKARDSTDPEASTSLPLADLAASVLSADADVDADADADVDAYAEANAEAANPTMTAKADVRRRDRAIVGIVGAMRLRKRRRQFRLSVGGVLLVAASITIAIGVGRLKGSAPTSTTSTDNRREGAPAGATNDSSGQPNPAHAQHIAAAAASFVRGSPKVLRAAGGGGVSNILGEGTTLETGDRVVVEPGSRATLAFATGTYVALDNEADIVLTSSAPEITLDLRTGSVKADVVKLRPTERFIVRTADTEVEVRGTSFEVMRVVAVPQQQRQERADLCSTITTRVKVREGVVAVRTAGGVETLVRANESWPAGCVESRVERQEARVQVTQATQATREAAPVVVSDLAAENDLFEKAVAKKREGDAAGAVAVLEQFLARYPSSHLTQSARAERMKLLRGIDRERARAAARDYLAQHPNGFARSDAELILSSTY